MAQTVKLRRSATSGAIPTTSQLALGELALNTYDGKVYMKKSVGGTETIVEVGAGTGLSSSFILYEYTATSGQTSFSGSDQNSNTLAYDTGTPPKIQVFLNGILLDYSTDYTATNGTSVTLTTGATVNDLVQIAAYKSYATVTSINLQDNQKLTFGDSNDLELFHNGTRSIINDAGTGDLQFQIGGSAIFDVTTDGIVLNNLDVEANEFIGDLRGAVLFKAQAGEALSKGDVVYISGISGNTTVVMKADADDASKMPAFGVASSAANANASVDIYTLGTLSGLDTSSYSEGDELFVSTTAGTLTATAPTGETALLQKIAKVTRSDASAGSIFITGAGRTNAVPNLDQDQFFLGNASNQAVAVDFSDAVEALSINNVVEDTTPQLGGDLASNGNDILFADSDKAIFGTGSDLQIYHDGSNSYITENGTGQLVINATNFYLRNSANNNDYITAVDGGAVKLLYANSIKLATTSTGIDVTGEVLADSLNITGISTLTSNNVAEVLKIIRSNATSNQLAISFSDGTNTRFFGKGTDNELYLATSANISTGSKIVTSGNFTGILDSTYYQSGDDISVGNITATGYLRGPSTFTIDPATHGDDTGTVVIAGNLQVDGTTTTINSTTLTVDDKLITLASGSINAAAADGAGIEVDITGSTNPSILYDSTNDQWDFNKAIESTRVNTNTVNNVGNTANIIYRSSTNTIVGNNASALVVQDAGNVGIGTSSPTFTSGSGLQIYNAGQANLRLSSTTNNTDFAQSGADAYIINRVTSGDIKFRVNGSTELITIDGGTGSVGINNSQPSSTYKLDVSGAVRSSADAPSFNLQETDASNQHWALGSYAGVFALRDVTGTTYPLQIEQAVPTNTLYLDSTGNVGIGTSSPDRLLHLNTGTTGAITPLLRLEGQFTSNTGNEGTAIEFITGSGGTEVGARIIATREAAGARGALRFCTGRENDAGFDDGNVVIDESGNVGIGTTTPGSFSGNASNLVVGSGSGTEGITISSGTTGYGVIYFADGTTGSAAYAGNINYYHADNSMRFGTNGSTTNVVIDSSGRLGIGTTTPDSKLTVNVTSNSDGIELQSSETKIATLSRTVVNSQVVASLDGVASRPIHIGGIVNEDVILGYAGGNVGIGTDSPDTKLDITTTGVQGLVINQDTVTAAVSSRLFFKDSTRTNLIMNANGLLEFRTDATIGSTSGTRRLWVSPSLVETSVPIKIEEYQIDTTETSTTATTQVAIHTFAAATFRSARFTVQVTNSTDSTYHLTEILLIHDGTTPSITEYGTIFTGSAAEATFDADINTGNVRLLATPASTDSMEFKVVSHSITV